MLQVFEESSSREADTMSGGRGRDSSCVSTQNGFFLECFGRRNEVGAGELVRRRKETDIFDLDGPNTEDIAYKLTVTNTLRSIIFSTR